MHQIERPEFVNLVDLDAQAQRSRYPSICQTLDRQMLSPLDLARGKLVGCMWQHGIWNDGNWVASVWKNSCAIPMLFVYSDETRSWIFLITLGIVRTGSN